MRFVTISDRRKINLAQVVEACWKVIDGTDTLVLATTAVDTVRDEDDPDLLLTIPHLITLTGETAQRVWDALEA